VSPLIGWLAERDCPANSQVFHLIGGRLVVLAIPTIAHVLEHEGRWTPEALDAELPDHLVPPVPLDAFFRN
jgi:hypothetical protein